MPDKNAKEMIQMAEIIVSSSGRALDPTECRLSYNILYIQLQIQQEVKKLPPKHVLIINFFTCLLNMVQSLTHITCMCYTLGSTLNNKM